MRTFNKLFIIFLSLVMAAGLSCMSVFADTDDAGVTYTVTVYSGNSGTFSDGSTVKVISGLKYGDEVQLNINSAEYKPVLKGDAADKYYARGFKIAGHDNDEISQLQLVDYKHKVDGDASFTIAYGMKGGLVKYMVNYVDENGNELLPSAEYYGMVGDTPVVSYQYVQGYKPAAYNVGRTLTENEADNVFNFVYAKGNVAEAEEGEEGAAGGNAANNANAGNAGAGNANAGADNAGADGTDIADNATPQAAEPDQIDIQDDDTPQAPEPEKEGMSDTQRQLAKAAAIGICCAAVLLAGLAVLLIKRRRNSQDTEA